jgi:hypothetical protein
MSLRLGSSLIRGQNRTLRVLGSCKCVTVEHGWLLGNGLARPRIGMLGNNRKDRFLRRGCGVFCYRIPGDTVVIIYMTMDGNGYNLCCMKKREKKKKAAAHVFCMGLQSQKREIAGLLVSFVLESLL